MATLIRIVRNETPKDMIIKIPGINPNNPLTLTPSVDVDLFGKISADELEALQPMLGKLETNGSITVINTIEETQIHAGGISHSLTEVDTGQKWIDGKTIFRKVFVVPAMGNDIQDFQALEFTMKSWISTGGFINDGTNILMLPVPVPNFNDSVVGVAVINSGTTLQIHTGSAGAHDGGHVILEYTKV